MILLNNGLAIFEITYYNDASPWWYPTNSDTTPEKSDTLYFLFSFINAVYKTALYESFNPSTYDGMLLTTLATAYYINPLSIYS